MSKKLGITKVALSALCGLCVAAGALALTPATAAAETTLVATNQYFRTTKGTVTGYTDGTNNPYFTNTGLTIGDNVTITYNGVFPNTWGTHVLAPKTVLADDFIAEAMMITYRAVTDRSKMITFVHRRHSSKYNTATQIALTDQIELKDGVAYLKGTNQAIMGWSNQNGKYNYDGCFKGGWSTSSYSGELAGSQYIDRFDMASGVCTIWNQQPSASLSNSYLAADVNAPEYLAAHDKVAGTAFAEVYTEEWANATLAALANGSIMEITYLDVNTTEISVEIQGWSSGNWAKKYFIDGKTYITVKDGVTSLKAGQTYDIREIFETHTTYRFAADGTTSTTDGTGSDLSKFSGYKNHGVDANGNSTWLDSKSSNSIHWNVTIPTNQKTYAFKLSAVGHATNAGLAQWSGPETVFTFPVDGVSEIKTVNGTVTDSKILQNGTEYTLPTAENTATEVFVGWANGTKLYKAGTQITVDGDATYTAKYLAFTTEDKASLRIAENGNGVRFTSKFNKVQAQEFLAMDNFAYSFGTKITSNNSTQSLDVEGNKDLIYENGDNYCFNAAIVNVKDINLTRVYHAKAYMTVTYSDGATATIEAIQEGNEGRSYAQILAAAKADETIGGLLKAAVAAEYERVFASKTLVPSITITVDGADVDEMTFATELNAYFANKTWKIGDTVDLSDITFAGYTVGGTLTGVMTERGLNITIALTTAA